MDESFDLSLLNEDLQCLVIEKLEYITFARFRQTNSYINAICGSHYFNLKHHINRVEVREQRKGTPESLYLRILIVGTPGNHGRRYRWAVWNDLDLNSKIHINRVDFHCILRSEWASEMVESFSRYDASVYSLNFHDRVECSPLEFSNMITNLKCSTWAVYSFLTADYFTPDVLKTSMEVHTDFTDKQLLQWSGESMWIQNDSISAHAINRLLKEWAEGKREITHFVISFERTRGMRDISEIVKDLVANPVWTPEHHELSLIGRIPFEELEETDHLYSMWRAEDIEDGRFLQIGFARISVIPMFNEKSYLRTMLNNEQRERLSDL